MAGRERTDARVDRSTESGERPVPVVASITTSGPSSRGRGRQTCESAESLIPGTHSVRGGSAGGTRASFPQLRRGGRGGKSIRERRTDVAPGERTARHRRGPQSPRVHAPRTRTRRGGGRSRRGRKLHRARAAARRWRIGFRYSPDRFDRRRSPGGMRERTGGRGLPRPFFTGASSCLPRGEPSSAADSTQRTGVALLFRPLLSPESHGKRGPEWGPGSGDSRRGEGVTARSGRRCGQESHCRSIIVVDADRRWSSALERGWVSSSRDSSG